MLDRFPESGRKECSGNECLLEKQPTDAVSCQSNFVTSATIGRFLCLFAKQSINLICTEAILLSKRGLGTFCIGLRCLHMKQNGTVPADAELSCTGLLE